MHYEAELAHHRDWQTKLSTAKQLAGKHSSLAVDERYGLCVFANKDLFVEKDALSSLFSASLGKHKEPTCQLAPRAGARKKKKKDFTGWKVRLWITLRMTLYDYGL